jgi:Zn-dependent protease
VHAAELERLASDAEQAQQGGDVARAIASWERALALLPESTKQHQSIGARLMELRKQHAPQAVAERHGPWKGAAAGAGTVALLVWKFKFVAIFLLTKAKFLILGLTKMSTLLSMFAFFGTFWALYGWTFAAGLVVSIYVHEMGHVWSLRRHGIDATAPMFIPGIGAVVRLRQALPDERVDAEVGLAGPMWGLGAALAAFGVYLATGEPIWSAIAWGGAFLNVFNLLPVWQLDGSRRFNAMSRAHRWIAVGVLALGWVISHNGIFVLLILVAGWRAVGTPPAREPDAKALGNYAFLVLAFSFLMLLHHPGFGG